MQHNYHKKMNLFGFYSVIVCWSNNFYISKQKTRRQTLDALQNSFNLGSFLIPYLYYINDASHLVLLI